MKKKLSDFLSTSEEKIKEFSSEGMLSSMFLYKENEDNINIIKTKPNNEFALELYNNNNLFEREIIIYKYFQNFDNEKYTFIIPKYKNSNEEFLVLEYLDEEKYTHFKLKDSITMENIILIIEGLADFHSFLSKKNIETNNENNFLKLVFELGLKDLKMKSENNLFLNLEQYSYLESLFDYILGLKPPSKTIIHGDFWLPNILLGSKVCFLDFQWARMDCFSIDLLVFLFTSVNSNIRRENFNKFCDIYLEKRYKNEGIEYKLSNDILIYGYTRTIITIIGIVNFKISWRL
jgi:aminoglycoside phosphotransferase